MFFALGFVAGMSRSGAATRLGTLAARISFLTRSLLDREPATRSGARTADGSPVALVRTDRSFYLLYGSGAVSGPVSPTMSDDLPIIDAQEPVERERSELLELAALAVRAEAALSEPVSEVEGEPDGTATLFLSGRRLIISIDREAADGELARAARALKSLGAGFGVRELDLSSGAGVIVRRVENKSAKAGSLPSARVRKTALRNR